MTTEPTTGKYHWRDGWYFQRQDDGSVVISRQLKEPDSLWSREHPLQDHTVMVIPASEWVSIVTEVSANTSNYAEAERFHLESLSTPLPEEGTET